LHLVGYLYYWQMGFNSVFKGLNCKYQCNNVGVSIESGGAHISLTAFVVQKV